MCFSRLRHDVRGLDFVKIIFILFKAFLFCLLYSPFFLFFFSLF